MIWEACSHQMPDLVTLAKKSIFTKVPPKIIASLISTRAEPGCDISDMRCHSEIRFIPLRDRSTMSVWEAVRELRLNHAIRPEFILLDTGDNEDNINVWHIDNNEHQTVMTQQATPQRMLVLPKPAHQLDAMASDQVRMHYYDTMLDYVGQNVGELQPLLVIYTTGDILAASYTFRQSLWEAFRGWWKEYVCAE